MEFSTGARVLVRPEAVPTDVNDEIRDRFAYNLGQVLEVDEGDVTVVWPNGYKNTYPAGTLVVVPLM